MIGLTLPDRPLTVLALGAHADDIEIGAGGTLLSLVESARIKRIHWTVWAAEGERALEARASASHFCAGVTEVAVSVHGFRDGFLPWQGGELKESFEALKREVEPDLVFAPHRGDRHQDHRTVAELVWNTFRDHLILEYEIAKYEADLGHPNLYVPLDATVAEAKIAALVDLFPSQAERSWFEPEVFRAMLRLRGMECNASSGYAEAFHAPKATLVQGGQA